MTTKLQPARQQDPIEALLPWYATGKITAADRTLVEAALRKDAELVRQLDIIREEMGHVAHLNESLRAPSTRSFEKVMTGIAAEPRKPALLTVARRGLLSWLGNSMMAFSPRTLAFAACTAVAVIAVQTIMLSGLVGQGSGGKYETASAPTVSVLAGNYAMVEFVSTAQASQIAAFLKQFNATIVDGPRASGLYRIRIGDTVLSKNEIDSILESMKRQNGIVSQIAVTQ
jgi:anti-sigma-K factor RskA